MHSNVKNNEKEKLKMEQQCEIDFSNHKTSIYDPNNQNEEPYSINQLSKFHLIVLYVGKLIYPPPFHLSQPSL